MTACSYCEREAKAAVLVRVGTIPADPKAPDLSRLVIVRFCDVDHRRPGR